MSRSIPEAREISPAERNESFWDAFRSRHVKDGRGRNHMGYLMQWLASYPLMPHPFVGKHIDRCEVTNVTTDKEDMVITCQKPVHPER